MQSGNKLTPINDAKTREQATYEAVRAAIVEGRWGVGMPLVGSRLADELGVSRITVANALKRLAGEGFVRLNPHRGAEVASLDPMSVREIYLMRGELEALSAQEAVRWVRPSDLDVLHSINREIAHRVAKATDVRIIRQVDREFHARLRDIAQMPLLAQTLLNLADQCEGYRARLLDRTHEVVPSPDRHGPILKSLQDQDANAAGAAMRFHILEGMRAVLAHLDPTQYEPQPDAPLEATGG